MTSAFVHAAASPTRTARTRALITGNICGISSLNSSSGNSRRPSGLVAMDKWGMIAYPAPAENSAAPSEEQYASARAAVSIRDAPLPSRVTEGAMKPMMISGTTKPIS